MQVLLIIVAFLGLMYFLFKKRTFDFFGLAYLSACIYFTPGFLGFVLYPRTVYQKVRYPSPLTDDAYPIMIVVLISIIIGGVLYDIIVENRKIYIKVKDIDLTTFISVAIGVVGFILTILTTGSTILVLEKQEMLKALNRYYILWVTGASIGAVLSYSHRRWMLFSICITLLLFNLWIGFRASLALAMMSILLIYFNERGRRRLINQKLRYLLLGLCGAFFMFIYKHVYLFMKTGDFFNIAKSLSKSTFYLKALIESEPFFTQRILHEVLEHNFKVGMGHFKGVLTQVSFFSEKFGATTTSFNSLFEPKLFPGVLGGMASNIWAEMWSSGGWPCLIIFMIINLVVLFIGSYLLRFSEPTIRGGVAIGFAYWAFYLHRNDFIFQINLEKRIFFVFLGCMLLSTIIKIACNQYSQNKIIPVKNDGKSKDSLIQ